MKDINKPFHFWTMLLAGLLFVACDASNGTAESAKAAKEVTPAVTSEPAKSGSEIVMYKSPTCGCCGSWAEHLRDAGFTVKEIKREDMDAIKSQYGVPDKLASCHTAMIDGYIIEGHVPAVDVKRLLKERPNIAGLTAPGMPMKSPGMQDKGQKPEGYDVLAFDKNGKATVFSHY
jgi:hypothetical protein